MSEFDEIQRAKEKLRGRLDELKRIYGRVMELSNAGGKAAVVEFLSEEFGASPLEKGNDVVIGSKLVQFDEDGQFLGMSDEFQRPNIAIRKHDSGNGEAGDT